MLSVRPRWEGGGGGRRRAKSSEEAAANACRPLAPPRSCGGGIARGGCAHHRPQSSGTWWLRDASPKRRLGPRPAESCSALTLLGMRAHANRRNHLAAFGERTARYQRGGVEMVWRRTVVIVHNPFAGRTERTRGEWDVARLHESEEQTDRRLGLLQLPLPQVLHEGLQSVGSVCSILRPMRMQYMSERWCAAHRRAAVPQQLRKHTRTH